jgi:hypothetical protein
MPRLDYGAREESATVQAWRTDRAWVLVYRSVYGACYDKANILLQRGEPVAELFCSCEQRHKIWGEFWWVGGEYRWIFFDDCDTSETYAEQVIHCPACSRPLERKNLRAASRAQHPPSGPGYP